MNFLLAWFVISVIFSIGVPQAILITEIRENSPAVQAGLKVEDKIISVRADSQKLGRDELSAVGFVDFVNKYQGKEIVLNVERGGKVLNIKAVPRINPPSGEGALGIGLIETGLPRQSFPLSFWEGLKASVDIVKAIFVALYGFFTKVFIGKANLEQVAGPVGIVKITSQAGSLGFVYLFQLLALISLNLAVINIFPFPALDGGRLLFLLIEKIKGSPLPPRFERYANAAGMGILLFLMILITIKDIIKF
jgi:regulator of sigma E protease